MKTRKNWIRTLVLSPLVILMMGNQKSCEEKPVAKRELKKIIELQKIESPPVKFGAGGDFDFEFVANRQMVSVLMASDSFAFRMKPPILSGAGSYQGGSSSKITSGDRLLDVSPDDTAMLKQWMSTRANFNAKLATESKEASCMINNPQAVISGSINAFEFFLSGGLTIGFTPGSVSDVVLTGAEVHVEDFRLSMSMKGLAPLTGDVLGALDVTSNQLKGGAKVGFILGPVTVGPRFDYAEPLAHVTQEGLEKAVLGLKEKMAEDKWFTRVLGNSDADIVIVGGNNVKLRVGDELKIYNEIYRWSGEACNSDMEFDGIAKEPVAYGKVSVVGRDTSIVTITKKVEENIQLGAKVVLDRLVEDIPVAPTKPTAKP